MESSRQPRFERVVNLISVLVVLYHLPPVKGVFMFTVRLLWSDGFDPSVYEQTFVFDEASPAPANVQAFCLRKARRHHRLLGGDNFQLLILAVCPDETAWQAMSDAAVEQYRKTCRMASVL